MNHPPARRLNLPHWVKQPSALVGACALTLILLAPAAASGQQPSSCTAPTWSVATSSTWLGPDSSTGVFGGRTHTAQLANGSRTFDATFKAKAADTSGLSILGCIVTGNCGMDDLLDWIGAILDWTSYSKGEVSRQVDLNLHAPAGSQAQVTVESSLGGLLGVSSFVLGHSSALVDADAWVHWGGNSRLLITRTRADDSLLDQGAYLTPVTATGSQALVLPPGGQLRIQGHLLAESRSEVFPYLGVAIGMAQFSDAVGGGYFAAMNPPISIPDPGLRITATITNVSPVLGVDQPAVYFYLGQAAVNAGTLCDGDGDAVQLSASVGSVVNNQDGTWSWTLPPGGNFQNGTVTITANDRKSGTAQASFVLVPRVSIDIKPKTTSNVVDLRAPGSIPVAVLASDSFDPVGQVTRSSLRFGYTGDEDSLLRISDEKPVCTAADVNDDAREDLVCRFDVSLTGFRCGASFGYLEAIAPAFGATEAFGVDQVVLAPCNTIQTPTVLWEEPLWTGFAGVAVAGTKTMSPGGATLYISSNNAIFSLPADGGAAPVQVNTGELGYAVGLAVSRDGATLFATLAHSGLASANPVIVSLPAAGGPATVLVNLPVGSAPGGLAVSPDGTSLRVAIGVPYDTVLRLPIAGGTPIDILSDGGFDVVADVEFTASGDKLYLGADGTDRILTLPAAGGAPTPLSTDIAFLDPVNIALSPDKTTLFVLDPAIRIDDAGRVVTSGGWNSAVFMGPAWGGPYSLLAIGGPEFALQGKIAVSPDGSFLYFGGVRRSTGASVVLRVPTGLND